MDVDILRSRFIHESLRRALEEQDREQARRAAIAFRNYFEWYGDRMPEPEKMAITNQLAVLEQSCSASDR